MGCGASAKKYEPEAAPKDSAPAPAPEPAAAAKAPSSDAAGAAAAPAGGKEPVEAPALAAAATAAPAAEPQAEPPAGKEEAPAAEGEAGGAAKGERPKKADFFANEDVVAVRERYKEWAAIFDALDTDRTGVIKVKELSTALRKVCGDEGVTQKQVKLLYHAMDQNNDGGVDFKEFCIMGEALSTGDFSQINGVDPKQLKSLGKTAAGGLMAKAKTNLVQGLKNGDLNALCDSYGAEDLRKENPALAEVFDACGADGTANGVLSLSQLRNALRKMCSGVSGKQIATLYQQMDKERKGSVAFPEFLRMVRAIQTGDVSAFKGVDAAAFQEAFSDSQALRKKAKENLVGGLRSGELEKLANELGEVDISPTRKAALVKANPEWAKIFESFDKDKSGVLNFKEVKVALVKICKSASMKQIHALYHSMDENGDGNIDLEEFCKMAKALETGDLKNYPKVDPAAFKSMVEEKERLREALTANLKAGLEQGTFTSLMEQWEADQKALRAKYPECAAAFEKLDAKEALTLGLKDVQKGVREVVQKHGKQVTNNQVKALQEGAERSAEARVDLLGFCDMVDAILSGDFAKFPKLDVEGFKKSAAQTEAVKESDRSS